MKILDINSKEVNIRISPGNYIYRSKLQEMAREKLTQLYPHEQIINDFVIPGSRCSVDFIIFRLKLVFEIDGRQHLEFSAFHHGERSTSTKFAGQIKRDILKTNWCEINNFKLVRITSKKDLEQLDV